LEAFAQTKSTNQVGMLAVPGARIFISVEEKHKVCTKVNSGSAVIFTGIRKTLLDVQVTSPLLTSRNATNLVALLEHRRLTCVGTHSVCFSSLSAHDQASLAIIDVTNGYITPGIFAFGNTLGI
jgi:hypothetical protein